ncbi:MAG: tetratricopeptide repeat protein [Terracidiphilus sp.]|jgi:tetratricopeptide (TPR) repeat protein
MAADLADNSTENVEVEQQCVAREIALRANADPDLTRKQVEFLDRQGILQEQQQELQRAELHNLRHVGRSLKLQLQHERMRLLLEFALASLALFVAGILVFLVYSAWNSRSVEVNLFDVPPALVTQGQSGKVVASALLDRLQALQAATRGFEGKRPVHDAWSGDIKVEIPEAHISIGELQRYLHGLLGKDVQITGELVQTPQGIELTVRGSGFPAKSFAGRADALPELLGQAAEYIYGQSETYRFGNYLESHNRSQEAVALVKAAYSSALQEEKPLLLNLWGNALSDLGQYQAALDKYRQAIALKPDFWVGYNNIMDAQGDLQEEEALMQTGLQMERIARRGHWFAKNVREIYFQNLDRERWDLPTLHKELAEDMAKAGGHGGAVEEEAPIDAQFVAQMHDPRTAELELQTSPGAVSDPYVIAQTHFVQGLMALDHGDYAKALPELQATDAAVAQSTEIASYLIGPSCWLALAEAWNPVPAEKVDADIARGGHLVDCYRFKADITDHRGDWTLAQQQYAAAVTLAPSIPSSYESWGEALARHGDYAGAVAKFKEANARGPHWADPLKNWGDALAAQKYDAEAVKEYEQAVKYAPNWGQLHLHWAQALERLGKKEEARTQYRAALDADLTVADRAVATAAVAKLDFH